MSMFINDSCSKWHGYMSIIQAHPSDNSWELHKNAHEFLSPPNVLRRKGFWLLWKRLSRYTAMACKAIHVRSAGLVASSRATSPGASPKLSPRSVVGNYDLEKLPIEWDNSPTIRERMRDGHNLCLSYDSGAGKGVSKYVDATVENLRINAPVLKPLVAIMKKNDLQLPAIEKLILAVEGLFQLAKLSRTSDHFYQEAWSLRRLISKLKRFTYRPAPPQDLDHQHAVPFANSQTHIFQNQ